MPKPDLPTASVTWGHLQLSSACKRAAREVPVQNRHLPSVIAAFHRKWILDVFHVILCAGTNFIENLVLAVLVKRTSIVFQLLISVVLFSFSKFQRKFNRPGSPCLARVPIQPRIMY